MKIGLIVAIGLLAARIVMAAPNLVVAGDGSTTNTRTALSNGTYNLYQIGYGAGLNGHAILTNATVVCTNDAGTVYADMGYNAFGSLVIGTNGVLESRAYRDRIGSQAAGRAELRIESNGRWIPSYAALIYSAAAITSLVWVVDDGTLDALSLLVNFNGTASSRAYLYVQDRARVTISNGIIVADSPSGGLGCIEQTGGQVRQLNPASSFYIAGQSGRTGEYHISGGSLVASSSNARIGPDTGTGSGLFHVIGTGATNIQFNILVLYSNGMLRCSMDTGGVTKITVTNEAYLRGTLDMVMNDGLDRNLKCLPLSDTRRTFDIVQAGKSLTYITAPALRLAPDDTLLWALTNDVTGKILQVKYMRIVHAGTIVTGR